MITFKQWKKLNHIDKNFETLLIEKTLQNLEGINWYIDIHNNAKKEYKSDYKLFLGLLGVTSQRNTLGVNQSLTINALSMIKEFNNPYILNYGIADIPIKNNIKRILNNRLPHGNKIKPYYKALTRLDLNQVVIDTWMLKIFNLRHTYKNPNKYDIKYIKYMIRKISRKLNLKPSQVQPCLWLYARKELNNTNHNVTRHTYYFNVATNNNNK